MWRFRNQKGQILIEYVLLILIAVTTAVLINKILTQDADDLEDMGVLRRQWLDIINTIGNDKTN